MVVVVVAVVVVVVVVGNYLDTHGGDSPVEARAEHTERTASGLTPCGLWRMDVWSAISGDFRYLAPRRRAFPSFPWNVVCCRAFPPD